jgi:hypothetical protein
MAADEYKTTLTDGTELVLSRKEQTVQIRQTTGSLHPGVIQIRKDELWELDLAIGDLIQHAKDW